MMKRKLCIIFLLLFACLQVTFAKSKEKPLDMSLRDAVVLALRYNASVVVEDYQRIVDKFSLKVALWQYDIQYSLTGAASYTQAISGGIRSENDSASLTPGATLLLPLGTQLSLSWVNPLAHTVGSPRFYNPSVVFNATQPLLKGFGPDVTLAPLYQAENTELINRLNMQNIVINTITTVIGQYAAVSSAKNNLKVTQASLDQSLKILAQQKALLKAGRIASADLVQFEASAASQKLQLEQAEVSYVQEERALLITLGIDPAITLNVTENVHLPTEDVKPLEECIQIALENNIVYQQALINLKNARIALTVNADAERPTLNASITQTQGGGSGGEPNDGLGSIVNGANRNTMLGLTLSVPINDLSLQQGYLNAKIALKQQEIQLDQLKRTVINDVINAYYTVLNQKEQIKQAELSVKLAQQSVDIANAKLKYGKVSAFEASTLQTNLLSAQVSYINTVTAYVTNLATLDQTIGITLDRWCVKLRY